MRQRCNHCHCLSTTKTNVKFDYFHIDANTAIAVPEVQGVASAAIYSPASKVERASSSWRKVGVEVPHHWYSANCCALCKRERKRDHSERRHSLGNGAHNRDGTAPASFMPLHLSSLPVRWSVAPVDSSFSQPLTL